MKIGLAPIGSDGYVMEIHHRVPLAEVGENTFDNFEFITRSDHRLGSNYKRNTQIYYEVTIMKPMDIHTKISDFKDKEFGKGASTHEITELESVLGLILPNNYKDFLKKYGWARFSHNELYGLGEDVPFHLHLLKNTLFERSEMSPSMPFNLVPILNDGSGNHYCLDCSRIENGECPIVFWSHELGDDQSPVQIDINFNNWLIKLLQKSHD
jgi:cell wall assembly regulator SMI1